MAKKKAKSKVKKRTGRNFSSFGSVIAQGTRLKSKTIKQFRLENEEKRMAKLRAEQAAEKRKKAKKRRR